MYNLWFHPLRHFPGPLEARATRIWYCRKLLSGKVSFEIGKMHEKYGDVVRIGPDELSFNDPAAWNDIYGYRAGKGEFMKDPTFYNVTSSGKLSIIGSDTQRHGELRRLMAHGYSDRALRDQIPIIKSYGDLFFHKIRDISKSGEPVDLVKWFNVCHLLAHCFILPFDQLCIVSYLRRYWRSCFWRIIRLPEDL